jgi:hypothetical protein
VSGDGQEDDLPTQKGVIERRYAAEGGDPAALLLIEDVGSRDRAERRKPFQKMIKMALAGQVRRIFVSRFDRLGVKGALEWGYYAYQLQRAGCRVIEASTGRDLTGGGLTTDIISVIDATTSAKEQQEKGWRSLSGKVKKARDSCCWNGGVAPYGYDRACYDARGELLWVFHHEGRRRGADGKKGAFGTKVIPCPQCKKKKKKRKADGNSPCPRCERVPCSREQGDMPRKNGREGETAAPIPSEDQSRIDLVRKAFAWYVETAWGAAGIARLCREAGYTMYGGPVTPAAITDILSNPAYCGDYAYCRTNRSRFNEFDGEEVRPLKERREDPNERRPREGWITGQDRWPELIDRDTFEKAQAKIAALEKGPRRPRNAAAFLKGILFCSKCRKAMMVRNVNGRGGYCCQTYAKKDINGNPTNCGYHYVSHDDAERVVDGLLAALKVNLTAPGPASVLALYAARGKPVDDLARMLREGADAFADLLSQRFPGDSRLGALLDDFRGLAGVSGLTDFLLMNYVFIGPDDRVRLDPDAAGRMDEALSEAGEAAGRLRELVAAIEREAAAGARVRLAELEAELKDVVLAKARAATERERGVLDGRRAELEAEMDGLTEHVEPLGARYAALILEVEEAAGHVAAAERALAGADGMRKAECVRQALGKVFLHFDVVQKKQRVMTPLRPDLTETEYTQITPCGLNRATSSAPSSALTPG